MIWGVPKEDFIYLQNGTTEQPHHTESTTAQMVEILLSHPQIDVNWGRVQLDGNFEPMPFSALDVASLRGLQEVVRLLISHPNIRTEATGPGNFSALHFAAKGGSVEVVEILLEKFDVNTADIRGRTALQIASQEGHSDVVKLLLGRQETQQDNDSRHSNSSDSRLKDSDNLDSNVIPNAGTLDLDDDSQSPSSVTEGNDYQSQSTGANMASSSVSMAMLTVTHVSCHRWY